MFFRKKIVAKIKFRYITRYIKFGYKPRNAKLPHNFGLVKLQNFYGKVTSLFSTHFILKLLIKIFQ